MNKILLKQTRADLYPVPTTLVTCCSEKSGTNVLTVSWTGILSSHPPTVYISVRPDRFSYDILKTSKRFSINLPHKSLLQEVDLCGNVSGREIDKIVKCNFKLKELEPGYPPVIFQCHHHLLCEKIQEISLGSHTAFLAEVKFEYVDEDCQLNGKLIYDKLAPIAYCRKDYYELGHKIGIYGKEGKL